MRDHRTITLDDTDMSTGEALAIIQGQSIELPLNNDLRNKLQSSVDYLQTQLKNSKRIYGINTGYGDSCFVDIPPHLIHQLPQKLYTYHRCGLGDYFSPLETRAILVARLISLSKGYSAIRPQVLEHLALYLNHHLMPCIPKIGSVGASGDLTPLSYIAAVLSGEHEVFMPNKDKPINTTLALETYQIPALTLQTKETLAIMNGTSVMTGLNILALDKARQLGEISTQITLLSAIALQSNPIHFHPELFKLKAFPGQSKVANIIYPALKNTSLSTLESLQDRYSIRCAPHVLGTLFDALEWMDSHVHIELNSVNDNPIFLPEKDQILHGGHFYGGHMAFVSDSLKTLLANAADLLDRQLAQLVDIRFNRGLPLNLSNAPRDNQSIHHGLKAVQILTSSLVAEISNLCMPVSILSRSTECHNQDKVSMGTIARKACT